MSKVYEALLRQQQLEQDGNSVRDPLAETTASPNETSENAQPSFELPAVIGTPIGPRSNEGALFSNFTAHSLADPEIASPAPPPPAPSTNGKTKQGSDQTQPRRPITATHQAAIDSRALAEKLKAEKLNAAPPITRRAESEIPNPKSEISNVKVAYEISNPKSEISNSEPEQLSEHPEFSAPETRNPQSAIRNHKQHEVRVQRIHPAKLHPRLILLTNPIAPECEQYRTLRTQLFHAAEKKKTQVVTITSTLAGEGKTSTTINLGLAIAQSHKRVLVIDGDLRRPTVAEYLGTRAESGFGEALRGEGDALDLLFSIEGHELYLLAVSRESANPTELLSNERLPEMLVELRKHFDFILIDSPPVMPFADARLLANHADAVMLVVRAGMAPYETVEKAIEALPAGKMIGVVLNDAELTEDAGYYDYYYNYAQRNQRRAWWQKLLRPIRNTNLGRKLKL